MSDFFRGQQAAFIAVQKLCSKKVSDAATARNFVAGEAYHDILITVLDMHMDALNEEDKRNEEVSE